MKELDLMDSKFLILIQKFIKELRSEDPSDIETNVETYMKKIRGKMGNILRIIFTKHLKSDEILSIRTRFFDMQGSLQNADYKHGKKVDWATRQATYEMNSPASFFYPPIEALKNNKIPIALIAYYEQKKTKGKEPPHKSLLMFDKLLELRAEHISIVTGDIIEKIGPPNFHGNVDNESYVKSFLKQIKPFKDYHQKHFSGGKEITDESLYNNFCISTIPKIKEMFGKETKRVYAYFIPVIFAETLVAHLTIISKTPLEEQRRLNLKKTYDLIGFSSHLLSSSVANLNLTNSKYKTYFDTQSPLLWHSDNKDRSNIEADILQYLSGENKILTVKQKKILVKGYLTLVDNAFLPTGELVISEKILENIIKPLLESFCPVASNEKIVNRLLYILKIALDNQNNLKNIPQYRQHFIHSFHVFLTGIRLLSSGENTLQKCCDNMNKINKIKITKNNFIKAWFFTSIFHDISYAIANLEGWVNEAVIKTVFFNRDNKEKHKIWARHQIANLFRFEDYNESLLQLINLIMLYSPKNAETNKVFFQELYEKTMGPYDKDRKSDHGILSAIMFLNATKEGWEKFKWIKFAADAMACHNSLWENSNKDNEENKSTEENRKTSFIYFNKDECEREGRNVLRDLLIISDSIQQWGRTESEVAQRIFSIKLSRWFEDKNCVTITMSYELEEDIRKYLKEDNYQLDLKEINKIDKEKEKYKLKNVYYFIKKWLDIQNDSETIEACTSLTDKPITLELKIKTKDYDLLIERFYNYIKILLGMSSPKNFPQTISYEWQEPN